MGFAFLILGLFPVVFLADMFLDQDNGDDDESSSEESADSATINEDGDFIAEPDDADISAVFGSESMDDPLQPITDDTEPFAGSEIDPDEVLQPIEIDIEPAPGADVGPADVLSPVDEPGEDYAGGGTALQEILDSETSFNAGIEMLGRTIGDTDDNELGDGGAVFAAEDDGVAGTGSGTFSDWDGTPILADSVDIDVVSGGDGDDDITLGDTAGYAAGGAGDDTLTAGEGFAALLGGDGEDVIAGQEAGVGLWADGGLGNDTILGSGGDDVLFGGAHALADAAAQDADAIDGGAGDDRIAGGFGADTLSGGDGDDIINHNGRVEEEIHWERHDFAWHIDNDADQLDGGNGNDTLVLDRADSASGGEGMDTFWVYFDDVSGAGAADIRDFAVGEDFLRVSLNPETDHGDLALDVAPSPDGSDGMVRVNGELVAILRGAANATSADVYVEVAENVFVA